MTLEQIALLYAAMMLPSLAIAVILALFNKWTAAVIIVGICMIAAAMGFLFVIILIYVELYYSFF